MEPIPHAEFSRAHIVRYYEKATYSYLIPIGFILFGFLWDFLLLLALASILPCSIIGLYFTKAGFTIASKQGDLEKKGVGYANMLLGIILLGIGLLSAGFAYVTVNK